jgi:hypothetical protein
MNIKRTIISVLLLGIFIQNAFCTNNFKVLDLVIKQYNYNGPNWIFDQRQLFLPFNDNYFSRF